MNEFSLLDTSLGLNKKFRITDFLYMSIIYYYFKLGLKYLLPQIRASKLSFLLTFPSNWKFRFRKLFLRLNSDRKCDELMYIYWNFANQWKPYNYQNIQPMKEQHEDDSRK